MKTVCCPRCKGTGRLPDAKAMGAELRKLRQNLRLSVVEMAKHLAVTSEYIYMIETGVRRATPEIRWGYYAAPGMPTPTKKKTTYAKTNRTAGD